FGLLFLIFSAGGYYFLKLQFPSQDPLAIVNTYLLFWALANVLVRYCLQNLSGLSIKPFMLLPIAKKSIVNYVLKRNMLDVYNLFSLLLLVPFSVNLLIQGYESWGVLGWSVALLGLVYVFNFLNIIVKNKPIFFWGALGVSVVIAEVEFTGLLQLDAYSEAVFQAFFTWPVLVLLPLCLAGYLGKTVYE